MKLELLRILAANNPCCMLVEMRGQSGEVYHFQGSVEGEQRVEDMLTHIAGEIASTRRKRPRPKYKVKSLMPNRKAAFNVDDVDTISIAGSVWRRKRGALAGDLPVPIDPSKVVWSKDAYNKATRGS